MPPLRGEQLGPKKAPSRLRCTYNWWQSREGRAFVSSGLPLSALETWDRPLKQRLRRNPTKTWKQVELDRERAIRAQRKATRVQRRQAASAAANAPPPRPLQPPVCRHPLQPPMRKQRRAWIRRRHWTTSFWPWLNTFLSSSPPPHTLQMATPTISDPPGTVYIGRIPHGFYEHQMREYFSQFGTINRLRLSRNRRTGASKHYAFIEFESAEVADIVARAMDKYLLFGHILQVRVIPQDQLHPDIWKGAGRRFKKIPWAKLQGKRLRDPQTRELWRRRINREEERRKAKADKLKDLGYDFEMPDLKQVSDVPAPQSTTEKPLAIDSISATEPITVAALLEDKQQDSVPSTTKITSKRRKTKAKAT